MSEATTTYDIKLRWLLEDRASRGTSELGSALKRAKEHSSGLESALKGAAAAAIGVFGFSAAKKSLIDFNSSMEQSRIGMAGLFQMNLGGAFEGNMARSSALIGALQERMKHAVGTTKEAVEMAGMLAQPFSAAGASLKEMENMTVGAVVGSKAMGIAADVAARDVDAALRGNFRSVDQFTGKLLGGKDFGFTGEEGRERFNKLSTSQRFDTLNEALNSKALLDMAKAQEGSFDGVLSTLQDTIQQFLGKVGQPVFAAITEELKEWNKWIEANGETIARWGKMAGSMLVEAFKALRDAMAYVIQHKGVLLKIAGAFAGAMAGGKFGGIGAAVGAAAGYAGGGLLGSKLDKEAGLQDTRDFSTMLAAADNLKQKAADWETLMQAKAIGGVVPMGGLDPMNPIGWAGASSSLDEGARGLKTFADSIGATNIKELGDDIAHMRERLKSVSETDFQSILHMPRGQAFGKLESLASTMDKYADRIFAQPPESGSTTNGKWLDKAPKIIIHHIEVKSDDPDRFSFGLEGLAEQSVKARSAAFGSMRQG